MGFFNSITGKKKLGIIAIILMVVVTVVLLNVLQGSGKPALKTYLEAESKSFKRYSEQIKNTVALMRENVSVYNKEPYKRRTELTAGIVSGDKNPFGLKNAQELFDVLAKCKLVTDTQKDPEGNKSLSAVSLLFDKSPFLDAELFSENDELTFSVPTILPDKYFGLKKGNMDKVYDRFGIPIRPKRVINLNEVVNTLEFKNESFDNSMAVYGAIISGMLSESNVKYEKDISLDIEGKKAACREVTVNFDKKQTMQLLQGLTKRISEDDALISMTFGNAAGVSELVREAGLFSLLNFLEKSGEVIFNDTEKKLIKSVNIENDIAGFKKKVAGLFENFEFPDGLQMKLAIDKSGNILNRNISLLALKQGSESGFRLEVNIGGKSLEFNDFRNFFVEMGITQIAASGNDVKLRLETALKPGKEKGDITGDIKIGFIENIGGALKSGLDTKINIDDFLDKLTLKRHTKIICDVTLDGANPADKGHFTGEFNTTSWSNKKFNTRNSNTGIELNLQMPSFDAGDFKLKLNLAREDKFGIEAFKLPTVNKESIVHLDTATDAELDKVKDEALSSFGTFYMANKPVFDAILGAK